MQLNQWKRETAGSQARGEEEAASAWPMRPTTARSLGTAAMSMAWKLEGNSYVLLSLALLSPALHQRTGSSLPCGDGVRSSMSMVGSAHKRCISLLLLTSPSITHRLQT